jgi:DNA-binding transcriptional ArsR family regulator
MFVLARHDMTRIAVAKHLKILQDAGLVVSRRRGGLVGYCAIARKP